LKPSNSSKLSEPEEQWKRLAYGTEEIHNGQSTLPLKILFFGGMTGIGRQNYFRYEKRVLF
jgi:hypothetical protein